MSLILGIDPGLNGAIAALDARGSLTIWDMPTWPVMIGNDKRDRVNVKALTEIVDWVTYTGCELAVMEHVGGRPKQSASAAFVFGYTVGLIYMALINRKIPVHNVTPRAWKGIMRVTGKRTGADTDDITARRKASAALILQRADQLFPGYEALFRGANGGPNLDRAEAALLALYGKNHAIQHAGRGKLTDAEFSSIYANA